MKDMHVFYPKYTPNSKLILIGGDGSLHRHQLHRQLHLSTPIHITGTLVHITRHLKISHLPTMLKLNFPIRGDTLYTDS